MSTWMLFFVLIMDNGSLAVLEAQAFTNELSCKQAANYAQTQKLEGVRRVIPVCKKSTNV